MIENLVDSSNEENLPVYWMEQPIYYFFSIPPKDKIFYHIKNERGHFPQIYIFPVIIPKQTSNKPYKRCLN